ncbi:tRNA (uracil-5-)-methyltransferase [Naumannella halotolerans]|uniref:tRNA (Uracil-5-)-methyltransferase n=1 Tax=Naumannella halotolerans TaxID=993414 RepID=A0A4R7JA30_9ACTN|nr:tRNA (uracil-5-)-methyltransferase [Naumannella halotolerans]
MTRSSTRAEVIGPLTVGPVAHGGHCIVRYEGRVIFVRHALPGERVRVRLTDTSQDRFWRGDAVEVEEASAQRVSPRCEVAGPGGCGGCDLQHVSAAGQLDWKTAVVREQLQRLGGLAWDGEVEGVDPRWEWRTRMRYRRDADGRLAMRRFRSHDLVALPAGGCPIAAAEAIVSVDEQLQPDRRIEPGPTGVPVVTEQAAGRHWTVAADGFWQVHPAAADTLVGAVLDGLAAQPGERAFDLFCGVGLFTGALADHGVQVWGVEYDRTAIGLARRNLADHGASVRFSVGDVGRELQRLPKRTDLIVLDPPRKGAGKKVVDQSIARRPRAIALVACDPAALGRDVGYFAAAGWQLQGLRAFDLFPQTHHIESVAILVPPTG